MVKRTGGLDDDRLTYLGLLFEASAVVEREVGRRLERDCGLPGQWFDVLLRLARSGGQLRMTELAGQTTLTPSGLSRAVDRLVEAGYVERASCPTDKRGAFAALTPAGRAALDAAVPVHLDHYDDVVVLTSREQAALASACAKLRDGVLDALDDAG